MFSGVYSVFSFGYFLAQQRVDQCYIARAEYLKSMVQSQRPLLRDTAGESRKKLLGLQSACCYFCMKEDTGIIAAIC